MANERNYSKRSGAWATSSRNNLFFRARLRLTFFYLAAIAIILTVFSIVLYQSFAKNIADEMESDLPDEEQAQTLVVANTVHRLGNLILLIDGTILFLVGGLSYWLAGKTLNPIQKTLEAQKRFTADVSHELRTPLAIMKTELEVALRDKPDANPYSQILSSNFEEVDRMNRMVDNLLSLSRMDSDQEQLQLSPMDLAQLVSQSIGKIKHYAESKGIRLALEAEKSVLISGDPEKIQQAILNIVKNAVDYSPEGGRVEVRVKKSTHTADLIIADHGIGISAEDLPHIFDRFFRADKSRSQKVEGNGLGLSITKWIIQKHHGNMNVQSLPGKGTMVTIRLPSSSSS